MRRILRHIVLCVCAMAQWSVCAAQGAPPIVDSIQFDDTSAGMGVAKERYLARGILLGCTPGHWICAVQRGGSAGDYGRSLAVSPGGEDLYISVEFVVPGTHIPGAVQATDITALDAGRIGYAYEYFDVHGGPANSGSNHGDYRIGEGWYYTNGPVAHRFVLHVGNGQQVFLDNVGFSRIANGGPLAVESVTWSAVRQFYR
jgi:hypothetical protein